MLYEYYNIIDIAERIDEEIEKKERKSRSSKQCVKSSKKVKPKYTNSKPNYIVT